MAPLLVPLLFLFLTSYALDITPNPDLVLGKKVPDVKLIDEGGKERTLSYFTKGKPLILSLIYTRCTSACPMIVKGIKDVVKKLGREDYSVLLIDFDERDGREELKEFRKRRNISKEWGLAVAKGTSLKSITEKLDFKFFYDKATDMFAHPNVLVVLSPDLKVSGYMLGVRYDPDKLSVMIDKAKRGEVNLSWVKGVFLKCFRFDPATGTYFFDWSFVAMVVGGLIPIAGMGYYLLGKPLLLKIRRVRWYPHMEP